LWPPISSRSVRTRSGLQALHGSILQGSVYARKVQIAAIAAMANGLWTSQIGRNLTDGIDGFLTGKRYLIHDRDPLFTGIA
jgi:hypothetical protein